VSAATTAVARLAECRAVSVRYDVGGHPVTALERIELVIESGEALALWGPSGSGKTTLLHALGGLLVPTEGAVLWKGEQLSSLDAEARGRARAGGIAYVFQGANLLPTFTAFENVSFAAWASARSQGDRSGREPASGPDELLGLVGLAGKLEALPAELSGGEQQRVAVARALAQAPDLLLCDEPTGHLDSDTAHRVLELIDALRERFGFTLVIATHDAGVAAGCGRRIQLADGRIAAGEPVA
jgi:ABC-type lipoprotein export system ATPase subunit